MVSSKPEQQVAQNFNHIHPLTKVDGCDEFTCDGCKTFGYGKGYHCASCNFKLHDYCATCPPNLCSFMHPFHELRQVCRRLDQTNQSKSMCNICHEFVEGLYYQCEECRFNVHPPCTRLPQHVESVHHPTHLLQLTHLGLNKTCMVCYSAIRSWRYTCYLCGTDIHMECVNSLASSTGAAGTQQKSQPQSDHVHQDKAQEPRTSKKRRMFKSFVEKVVIGVVCNLIASPISDLFSGKKSTGDKSNAGGEANTGDKSNAGGEPNTGGEPNAGGEPIVGGEPIPDGEPMAGWSESIADWSESIADWGEFIAGWF